jgi:flavorubredoxin
MVLISEKSKMVFETISRLWILFIRGVITSHNIDLKFAHPKKIVKAAKKIFSVKRYEYFFTYIIEEDYMKTLVIYDTNYGNTKRITKAVASKLGKNSKSFPLRF